MFEEQVMALSEARKLADELQCQVSDLRAEWELQHSRLLEALAFAKLARDELENTLRSDVVEHFGETGNKKPHPALGIRESVAVLYDPDDATEYAKRNALGLLALDKRAFEKFVKSLAGKDCSIGGELAAIVKFEKVPTATIAKDLEGLE